MAEFATSIFMGMKPRLSEYLLTTSSATQSQNNALFAENCDFMSGALVPLRQSRFVKDLDQDVGGIVPHDMDADVYRTVSSPSSWVDAGTRTIYTSDEGPRYFLHSDPAKDFSFGRMPDLATEWVEGNSPVVPSLVRTGVQPQPEDPEYFYTISVANTETGDESGLSAWGRIQASANNTIAVELTAAQVNALRDLLDDKEEDVDSMELRIYRSLTADYILIGREALPDENTTFTFDDVISQVETGPDGEEVGPVRYRWPLESTKLPDDARGMILHPNNFLICHNDTTVFLSDPIAYSQFPQSLSITFQAEKVIGVQEFLNRVIIFFQDAPHRILELGVPGDKSERLISPEAAFACVSQDSIAKIANGILYAGKEGIYITDGYQSQLIDDRLFDSVSFEPYHPESVRIFGGDREFIVVSATKGTFLFRRDIQMTRISEDALDAVWNNSNWWILKDGEKHRLEKAFDLSAPRTMKWEGGLMTFSKPISLRNFAVPGEYEDTVDDIGIGGLGSRYLGGTLTRPNTREEDIGPYALGQSPSDKGSEKVQRQVRLSIKMDRNTYEIPNPITRSQASNMKAGAFRQSRNYGFIIEGDAEVNQVVIASREKLVDRVPHPTLARRHFYS